MNEESSAELTESPTVADAVAIPVQQTERIVAIDVLRGVALLGILVMNIRAFASVFASYGNPTIHVDWTGVHRWVWLLGHVFADMKMMAIFSMLFGAGLVLMTSRSEARIGHSAGIHYRRMMWLLLIGLIHAHVIWTGDILVMYAECGMIVYLFRHVRPGQQIAMGLGFVLVGIALMVGIGMNWETLPPPMLEGMKHMWEPTIEVVNEEIAAYRGSWWEQAALRSPNALGFETFGFITFGLWRAGGLMLVGMGLFKLGVFSAARSHRFYWCLLLGGILIGVPLILMGYQRNVEAGFSADVTMFLYSQFNYIGSIFVALAWVGLVMLIVKAGALKWLTSALAAVGQMALTNYLMHSIICTTIFYGHGLGLFGQYNYLEQMYFVLGIWIVELIWSPLWLRAFRFGPFEWLWRSLTYWQLQPLKR